MITDRAILIARDLARNCGTDTSKTENDVRMARLVVDMESLACQRETRDVLKMIDHRLQQFTIESKRDPIGHRLAGLLIAKRLVENAEDRLAALGDIEQTIAEMRAQMDGPA